MPRTLFPIPLHGRWSLSLVLALATALLGMFVLSGCIQHRVSVSPPVPAAPVPAGEDAVITQMISGSKVVDAPHELTVVSSPLPIDLPISVWRRDSDGLLSRGESRVTTGLPWWQRFPADIFTDLTPIDAEVFASGSSSLTPITLADQARLFDQAARDGYAHKAIVSPSPLPSPLPSPSPSPSSPK